MYAHSGAQIPVGRLPRRSRLSFCPISSAARLVAALDNGWKLWVAGPPRISITPPSESLRKIGDAPRCQRLSKSCCAAMALLNSRVPPSRRHVSRAPAIPWARNCQLASQVCCSLMQYGSSSWAASTGETPRVKTSLRPSSARVSRRSITGRYEVAHAWCSHSSPTGQAPW